MAKFSDVFSDETRCGRKIPTNEYLPSGKYPIIDQGQIQIAGYTNSEDGLYRNIPAIVFGDHTRIIKYVDTPFFLGADGVKLLKSKIDNVDYKYLYYSLQGVKIPDTGYNRHFKWLKEAEISLPPLDEQRKIAAVLDKVSDLVAKRRQQLDKLDLLVKSKFVEMFGDPVYNDYKWPVQNLESICKTIVDCPHSTPKYTTQNTGYMCIRTSIVKKNHILWDEIECWSREIATIFCREYLTNFCRRTPELIE